MEKKAIEQFPFLVIFSHPVQYLVYTYRGVPKQPVMWLSLCDCGNLLVYTKVDPVNAT